MSDQAEYFMQHALAMAQQGIDLGHGGPFGAVVVIDGKIVGQAWNQVVHLNDPTAHAEVLAIRRACRTMGCFHLPNATLYTTCEPCPMCMGACYWARIGNLVYGATAEDAATIGFDDHLIKNELRKPLGEQKIHISQRLPALCRALFTRWSENEKRIDY